MPREMKIIFSEKIFSFKSITLDFFTTLPIFITEGTIKPGKAMKRIYRDVPTQTREKISAQLKGRSKTADHRQKIAQAMERYWSTIEYSPERQREQEEERSRDSTGSSPSP